MLKYTLYHLLPILNPLLNDLTYSSPVHQERAISFKWMCDRRIAETAHFWRTIECYSGSKFSHLSLFKSLGCKFCYVQYLFFSVVFRFMDFNVLTFQRHYYYLSGQRILVESLHKFEAFKDQCKMKQAEKGCVQCI